MQVIIRYGGHTINNVGCGMLHPLFRLGNKLTLNLEPWCKQDRQKLFLLKMVSCLKSSESVAESCNERVLDCNENEHELWMNLK